jgi:predicted amidohydrolase YtcJ
VADRGDQYLTDVDCEDLPHLWPYRSLLDAGVRVAPSSDAPFGDPDPWRGMAAAVTRRTLAGLSLGGREAVDALTVLNGYLTPLDAPGGPPRRVTTGAEADLVLLRLPLDHALADPSAGLVALTIRGGIVFPADAPFDKSWWGVLPLSPIIMKQLSGLDATFLHKETPSQYTSSPLSVSS